MQSFDLMLFNPISFCQSIVHQTLTPLMATHLPLWLDKAHTGLQGCLVCLSHQQLFGLDASHCGDSNNHLGHSAGKE